MEHRRTRLGIEYNDDDSEEGELDSSINGDDDDVDVAEEEESTHSSAPPISSSAEQTSQSWTTILSEQNLSSIMTNALADRSQIIHIDDPITQQSSNPLNYGFPQGTDVSEYFQRKQKQIENQSKPKYRCSRRQVKNLSQLLNREKNIDLLRTILETIGHGRAFEYAQQAKKVYENETLTLKQCSDGRQRSLGGVFFKMLMHDDQRCSLTVDERERIKRENQKIQKGKKKQKKMNSSSSNGP